MRLYYSNIRDFVTQYRKWPVYIHHTEKRDKSRGTPMQ
jgi:hypothetical protein